LRSGRGDQPRPGGGGRRGRDQQGQGGDPRQAIQIQRRPPHGHGQVRILDLFCSVADADPGSSAFLTPESGIQDGRKIRIRIRIRDEQPGLYFRDFKNNIFKFFDADPGSGMEKIGSGIRDEKKSDPG
jgi:hypothetical protein